MWGQAQTCSLGLGAATELRRQVWLQAHSCWRGPQCPMCPGFDSTGSFTKVCLRTAWWGLGPTGLRVAWLEGLTGQHQVPCQSVPNVSTHKQKVRVRQLWFY